MTLYGTQDVWLAISAKLKQLFGNDMAIYLDALPATGVIFPHFQVKTLSISPVRSRYFQLARERNTYQIAIQMYYRHTNLPVNEFFLQSILKNVMGILASDFEVIHLNNSNVRIVTTGISNEFDMVVHRFNVTVTTFMGRETNPHSPNYGFDEYGKLRTEGSRPPWFNEDGTIDYDRVPSHVLNPDDEIWWKFGMIEEWTTEIHTQDKYKE